MKLNYIIIDADPRMHKRIEDYCNDLDYMTLMSNCYTVNEAMEAIKEKSIDLIFMDINLPKLEGDQFLRSLKNPVKIIVVTSSKEESIEGYELNISDYLLKPLTIERFIQSLENLKLSLTKTLFSLHQSKMQNDNL